MVEMKATKNDWLGLVDYIKQKHPIKRSWQRMPLGGSRCADWIQKEMGRGGLEMIAETHGAVYYVHGLISGGVLVAFASRDPARRARLCPALPCRSTHRQGSTGPADAGANKQ
jgi:hypothetical protein